MDVNICKQVIHSSKYSLDISPKMEHNQLQKYLYFFSKHLPSLLSQAALQKSTQPRTRVVEKKINIFQALFLSLFLLFSPDTLSTRDPQLIRCNPNACDASHILCFYEELKRKSLNVTALEKSR